MCTRVVLTWRGVPVVQSTRSGFWLKHQQGFCAASGEGFKSSSDVRAFLSAGQAPVHLQLGQYPFTSVKLHQTLVSPRSSADV